MVAEAESTASKPDTSWISIPKAALSVVLVFIGLPILHWIVSTLSLGEMAASAIASTISLPSVGLIYAALHGRSLRLSIALLPPGIVPAASYLLPWYVLAAFGALMLAGTAQFGSLLGALLGGTVESAVVGSLIMALTAAFVLGRWVGTRADRWPLVAAAVMAMLARVVVTVVDVLLIGPDDYRAIFGVVPSLDVAIVTTLAGTILWGIPALAGAFFGSRSRYASYAAYLLKRLSESDRSAAISLLYDEAQGHEPVGPAGPIVPPASE